MTQDAQAELTGLQRESERAFLVKLTPALEKVTRDKGLLLVFNVDAGLIPWFAPSIDITADVVKQLVQK
jgi:Skp family chaperone for outer membrane proteins